MADLLPRAVATGATALLALAWTATVPARTVPASAASSAYTVARAIDPHSGRSTVIRWSPCTVTASGIRPHVISYRVNAAGAVSRVRLVKQALTKLTAASGLRFRYLGTTTYVPHNDVVHYATGDQVVFAAAQERAATGAELVVSWAARSNMLSTGESGVGTAGWSGSRRSQLRIVEAAVVMKRGVALKPGFTAGASVGALLLHELGHAVGLEHVAIRSQIMYPVIGSWSRAGYHAGDDAGLRLVGAAAGCMSTPAAAPADPVAMARAAGVRVTG